MRSGGATAPEAGQIATPGQVFQNDGANDQCPDSQQADVCQPDLGDSLQGVEQKQFSLSDVQIFAPSEPSPRACGTTGHLSSAYTFIRELQSGGRDR